MNKVTFNCPACDLPLTVPASAASATGPCPECGEMITGPGLEPEPEAPPVVDPFQPQSVPDPAPEWEEPAQPDVAVPPAAEQSISEANPGASLPAFDPELMPDAAAPPQWDQPIEPARRGLGLGAVAALCILCSAACLALGYQLGRSADRAVPPGGDSVVATTPPAPERTSPEAPIPVVAPGPVVTSPAPEPVPVPEPDPEPEQEPEPSPSPEPVVIGNSGPDTTAMLSFLNAKDWSTRHGQVLFPEQVRSDMESLASKYGDGPVEFTGVTRMRQSDSGAVFEVKTASQPKGFPVAVALVDGRWLVDWAGFADFHYGLFPSFVADQELGTGTFRLLIRPELARVEDEGRQPYAASTTDVGSSTMIHAKMDSPVYQKLEDMIGALATKNPTSFRTLMENGGVPVILHLKKTVTDDETIIFIDRVVGQSWSPVAPDAS